MPTTSHAVYQQGYGPDDVLVREVIVKSKLKGYYACTSRCMGICHTGPDLHPTVDAALACFEERGDRRCRVCGEPTGQPWALLCLRHWKASKRTRRH